MDKKGVFRKVSLDRLASPEQLDQLMQITNSRSWLAAVAVGLILVAALTWSMIAELPLAITSPAVLSSEVDSSLAMVYLSPGEVVKVMEGMPVEVALLGPSPETVAGHVVTISDVPSTPENIAQQLNNPSLATIFATQPLLFQVTISLDNADSPQSEAVGTATIILGSYRPISLVIPIN